MSKANPIGLLVKSYRKSRSISKWTRVVHIIINSHSEVLQTHLYILNKTNKVIPYLATKLLWRTRIQDNWRNGCWL